MMKSPVNGVLIMRPVLKDEFVPIKTFTFHQNILDMMSHLSLCQEYIVAGDKKGGALLINMRNGQQKRIQFMDGEVTSVAEVAAMTSVDG
jgi:hypothetical protein